MPDEPPLLRQWKLMSLLSARHQGLTIPEMAREMNVVEKTIRRDLDLFRQVGLPVDAATASGDRGCKRWRIAGTRGQPPLTFNFQEAAALYLAGQLLEPARAEAWTSSSGPTEVWLQPTGGPGCLPRSGGDALTQPPIDIDRCPFG